MKKLLSLFFAFVFLFTFSTGSFFGGQVEAASKKQLSKEETKLLFFSSLVYSVVDAYPAGTSISKLDLDSKYFEDFKTDWKTVQDEKYYPKMTANQFVKKHGLNDWVIYDYLDGEVGKQAYYHDFFGVIFKNTKTNEYVVAFRGSSTIGDYANNLINIVLAWHSHQLPYAEKLVAKLPKNAKKVTLTGHSLGGYIASYVTLKKGYKGVTFNAPGFSGKYKDEVKNSKYKSKLIHHTMEYDDLVGNRFTKYGKEYKYVKKDAKLTTPVNAWHSLTNFYQYAAK